MRTLRERNDTLKKLRVKRIGLFGSYARGRQTGKSDLDFLVEFEEPDYDNFLALADYLEQLFGKKVDLLTPDGVKGIRVKSIAASIKKSVVYVYTTFTLAFDVGGEDESSAWASFTLAS